MKDFTVKEIINVIEKFRLQSKCGLADDFCLGANSTIDDIINKLNEYEK